VPYANGKWFGDIQFTGKISVINTNFTIVDPPSKKWLAFGNAGNGPLRIYHSDMATAGPTKLPLGLVFWHGSGNGKIEVETTLGVDGYAFVHNLFVGASAVGNTTIGCYVNVASDGSLQIKSINNNIINGVPSAPPIFTLYCGAHLAATISSTGLHLPDQVMGGKGATISIHSGQPVWTSP